MTDIQRLAEGLAALDIDAKDDPVTAALDAITFRHVDLDRLRDDHEQAVADRDAARAALRELVDQRAEWAKVGDGGEAEAAITQLAAGLRGRHLVTHDLGPRDLVRVALRLLDESYRAFDELSGRGEALVQRGVNLEGVFEGGLTAEQEIRALVLPVAVEWAKQPWSQVASEEQLYALVDRFVEKVRGSGVAS